MLLLFVNAILNKLNYNRCIRPCQQQCGNISKSSIFCSAVRAKCSSGIQLGTACSAITLCRTIGFCGVIGGKPVSAARAESGKLVNLTTAARALNCAVNGMKIFAAAFILICGITASIVERILGELGGGIIRAAAAFSVAVAVAVSVSVDFGLNARKLCCKLFNGGMNLAYPVKYGNKFCRRFGIVLVCFPNQKPKMLIKL